MTPVHEHAPYLEAACSVLFTTGEEWAALVIKSLFRVGPVGLVLPLCDTQIQICVGGQREERLLKYSMQKPGVSPPAGRKWGLKWRKKRKKNKKVQLQEWVQQQQPGLGVALPQPPRPLRPTWKLRSNWEETFSMISSCSVAAAMVKWLFSHRAAAGLTVTRTNPELIYLAASHCWANVLHRSSSTYIINYYTNIGPIVDQNWKWGVWTISAYWILAKSYVFISTLSFQ